MAATHDNQAPFNQVFQGRDTTIFTTMSNLAAKHDAINLGQGFPDVDGPLAMREEAARRFIEGPNQYAPAMGVNELRQAVADHNKRAYGIELDWQSEIMVTSGATEALLDCLMAMITPGDEVVLIEPFYDCYLPIIERAGGIAKMVSLKPPQWDVPQDQLEQAFSDKTRLILLNTPMNPCSKVFSVEELDQIAALCLKHDAYAICDEVYENLVFDNHNHVSLMTRPNMKDRCVRIGSAGKSFSFTGWKIGYVSAPQHLMSVIAKAHQYFIFATPTALQYAVAYGLNEQDEFVRELASELEQKRDFLKNTLEGIGLETLPCEATYFMTADVASLGFDGTDMDFCEHITINAKVAAIPMSAFYHPESPHVPDSLVRFCFSKQNEVLEESARRLKALFS